MRCWDVAENRRVRALRLLILLATLCISIALVLGFFGRLHPAMDSFAHFRLHLAALLFVCGIALLGYRYWLHGLVAVGLSIGCVFSAGPHLGGLLPGPVVASAQTTQPVYKLMELNVSYSNPDPKAVLSLIARQRPDIITLAEVNDRWRRELDLIKIAYPYRLDCEGEPFGTVILSRRPMDSGHNPYCAPDGRVALAQIDLNGRFIHVLALHLPWPWPFDQADMIEAHAPLLGMLGDTAIVAGDFNATPWSATFRKVAGLGGLKEVQSYGPTWIGHHSLPLALKFLGLPIDQIMTKGRVVVHSARTLESVGSDHLPVLLEFSIAPDEGEPRPTQTVLHSSDSMSVHSRTNARINRSIFAPS